MTPDLQSIIDLHSQELRFSVAFWAVSVAFVVASGFCAWCEGNWRRGARLDIGFLDHGGMWSDLLLLPIVNAVIAPWISWGAWLIGPALAGVAASWWVHAQWFHGGGEGFWREHLWPARRHPHWTGNLSWAGWLHVLYVAAEIALLVAYAVTPVPLPVVAIVTLLLTLHVPIGLFAPAWVATGGRWVRSRLLWPTLITVWSVAAVKGGWWGG